MRKEREGNYLSFRASWASSLLIPLPYHPHADFGVNFISELGRRPGAGQGLQAPGVTNACLGPAMLLLLPLSKVLSRACVSRVGLGTCARSGGQPRTHWKALCTWVHPVHRWSWGLLPTRVFTLTVPHIHSHT